MVGGDNTMWGDQSNPMLHRKRQRLLRDSLTYWPDSEIA